jgi:hypothetical protein
MAEASHDLLASPASSDFFNDLPKDYAATCIADNPPYLWTAVPMQWAGHGRYTWFT